MELKLDRNKEYALVFEGGGAKGAYEVGVWDALDEEGIKINAVAGTSVGALNAAFVAMDELEEAKRLWREVKYSTVIDVDDDMMSNLLKGKFRSLNLAETARSLTDALVKGGFDVNPLLNFMNEHIDEKKVKESPRDMYFVTVSLTDRKEVVMRARDLEDGELTGMILASCYLPVFRSMKLGGKRYIDGGFADNLPVLPLIRNGYKDIIAVKLKGIGVEKKYKVPDDVTVTTITHNVSVGGILDFEGEKTVESMRLGYFDAKRVMYGLAGSKYYIERTMTEDEAYAEMVRLVRAYYRATGREEPSARYLNERILPSMAVKLRCFGGDYYDLFIAAMEASADDADIDRFAIYNDRELMERLEKEFSVDEGKVPEALVSVRGALRYARRDLRRAPIGL